MDRLSRKAACAQTTKLTQLKLTQPGAPRKPKQLRCKLAATTVFAAAAALASRRFMHQTPEIAPLGR